MALRLASIGDSEKPWDQFGFVFYDSTTLYVYPPVFTDQKEAEAFLLWFERTYKVVFNDYTGDHYAAHAAWLELAAVRHDEWVKGQGK